MLFGGMGVAMVFLLMIRQFADVMALAGAVEDQQTGRQRETGSAKEKSHNASHSKGRGLGGARRKAGPRKETPNV
jgi:Na+-transporting methylmalonyl-CoA/oxaloacetate decarboxylase gamma subunit